MAGFRIVSTLKPDKTPKAKPTKSKDYLAFVHELPCVITGRYGVEAAHVSFAAPMFGHYGRGKSSKASDRWVLPMSREEHARAHSMSEFEYWRLAGRNPHLIALTIWGLFTEFGEDAVEPATAVINGGIWK